MAENEAGESHQHEEEAEAEKRDRQNSLPTLFAVLSKFENSASCLALALRNREL